LNHSTGGKARLKKAMGFLALMKSKQNLFVKLTEAVKEIHSYEVPEILAVPIVKGYRPYLEWLNVTLVGVSE
jgi:periplasmic divalent cation tolerance protein